MEGDVDFIYEIEIYYNLIHAPSQFESNNHINKHKIQYEKEFSNNYLNPENLLLNIKSIEYNFPIKIIARSNEIPE